MKIELVLHQYSVSFDWSTSNIYLGWKAITWRYNFLLKIQARVRVLLPVSRGGAEQEDARPDNVLGVYFPYHVPLVAFKAALTLVFCLSSSHLAFRNVCWLSPTVVTVLGGLWGHLMSKALLWTSHWTLEGETLRRFICVYFPLFSLLLLAVPSILPREALPPHVGYPVMCPNAVLII